MTRLGVTLLGASGLLVAFAAQSVQAGPQESPGTPVTSLNPATQIANGTTTGLVSSSSTVPTIFVGFSAADTDLLSLPGATVTGVNNPGFVPARAPVNGTGGIFINQGASASPIGTVYSLSGFGSGTSLQFNLLNQTTNNPAAGFNIGPAFYANTAPAFTPVYHFAIFSPFACLTGCADSYDASFLATPGGIPIAALGAVDSFITNNGGYPAWTFVGLEDLNAAATDDWNNLVYAFENVGTPPPPVPEPASLALLGTALAAFGVFRRRRKVN